MNGKIREAVRSVYAERGLRTFYKGYTAAVLSLAPFIAVNFAAFDGLKTWYYGPQKASKEQLKGRNPLVSVGLGAAAGIIAQTFCYPLGAWPARARSRARVARSADAAPLVAADTVRRRMQLKGRIYPNTAMAFVIIMRDEGPRGFYRGMVPNALKVMPNNASEWLGAPLGARAFRDLRAPPRQSASERTSSSSRTSSTRIDGGAARGRRGASCGGRGTRGGAFPLLSRAKRYRERERGCGRRLTAPDARAARSGAPGARAVPRESPPAREPPRTCRPPRA